MLGANYINQLFAIISIPARFWDLIKKDLRYDGFLRVVEGFVVLLAFPVLSAVWVVLNGIVLDKQFYSLMIPSASLFVGFSMNAILLLLRYSDRDDASEILIDQTRNMVTYILYVGIAIATVSVAGYVFSIHAGDTTTIYTRFTSYISVFLMTHFMNVILFLPARIFTVIESTTN